MCWSRTNCPHKSAMLLTMKYCIHYSLSSLFYINLVFYNRIIKHAWSYIFRIELEARVTFDDFTHKAYSPYIQMGLCKVVHQIFRVYCADKICTQASHEFVLVTDNFFFHPLPSPAWHSKQIWQWTNEGVTWRWSQLWWKLPQLETNMTRPQDRQPFTFSTMLASRLYSSPVLTNLLGMSCLSGFVII